MRGAVRRQYRGNIAKGRNAATGRVAIALRELARSSDATEQA